MGDHFHKAIAMCVFVGLANGYPIIARRKRRTLGRERGEEEAKEMEKKGGEEMEKVCVGVLMSLLFVFFLAVASG